MGLQHDCILQRVVGSDLKLYGFTFSCEFAVPRLRTEHDQMADVQK